MTVYLGAFVVAVVVTYVLTPMVKNFAVKVGAVDRPDSRKVHHKVIPRLGGLAIYIGYMVSVLYNVPMTDYVVGLLTGSTVLVLVGIWDDIKQIGPRTKLVGQILAAGVLVAFGIQIDYVTSPWGHVIFLEYLSIPLTIFWIVGFTNIVNLIDGLDGLAAGISLIACVAIFSVTNQMGQTDLAAITLALAGAASGFLRYNFNPAKIFMGDTGSMLLGYTMAAISVIGTVKTAATIALVVPVIVLGLPILDTTFAILRRYLSGKPVFKPDKGHIHHRLLAMGLSQKQAVLMMYAVTALLGCLAVIIAKVNIWLGMLLVVLIVAAGVFVALRLGVITPPKTTDTKK